MALMFLGGYSPPLLDAVLDATGPCGDEPGQDYGPEPYCTGCQAPAGIFTAYGRVGLHYPSPRADVLHAGPAAQGHRCGRQSIQGEPGRLPPTRPAPPPTNAAALSRTLRRADYDYDYDQPYGGYPPGSGGEPAPLRRRLISAYARLTGDRALTLVEPCGHPAGLPR